MDGNSLISDHVSAFAVTEKTAGKNAESYSTAHVSVRFININIHYLHYLMNIHLN